MQYEIRETWLTLVNPSLKFLLIISSYLIVLFTHNPNTLFMLLVLAMVLVLFFSGHPYRFVLLYMTSFLLLFVSSASAMVFFGRGDTTWFHYGIVHITEESFYRGIHIGLRAAVFAMFGLLFVLTTKPVHLFYSFMQQLKLRPTLAYSFMAAIRVLPIMVQEFQTLRYAYQIRGLNTRKGLSKFYHQLQFFSIPLLAQAIRKAQRLALAMEAKQFTSCKKRTFFYKIGFSQNDIQFSLLLLAMIATSVYFGAEKWIFPVIDVRYLHS